MPEELETERLLAIQERRAKQEDEAAERASDPDERQAHERRADKVIQRPGVFEVSAHARFTLPSYDQSIPADWGLRPTARRR